MNANTGIEDAVKEFNLIKLSNVSFLPAKAPNDHKSARVAIPSITDEINSSAGIEEVAKKGRVLADMSSPVLPINQILAAAVVIQPKAPLTYLCSLGRKA